MENERWQKLEQIYHAALEKNLDDRELFLKQACAGDESLYLEVAALLAEAETTDQFLDVPAIHLAAKAIASSQPTREFSGSPTPGVIGRYRVIRLLGEGGMGAVYEAVQEEPSRSVALKIIRPGLATPERLRRFRHEFQALGRLQHSGIAQIYEAGTADTGFGPQPYFAMELVRGQSLSECVAAKNLTIRQKLALMIKICEAVQHAHERGLIHRDLKPGNILVDGSGQPKILDFGVARVTKTESQPTILTEVGQIVGTVAYMSPEQISGDPREIDARSDIYSLGVILYELLSGRLPYEVKHRQIHEAVQTIRDTDPTSLSSISGDLRGDVETIVGKALEKDKARRYSSAASFAEDIRRFLNDEPILARAPTTSYQLRKFARRHRVLVGSIGAVFVVLMAGVITSTTFAFRANRAREAALRDRDRANRITDFMTSMFKVSDPSEARGNSVTAREILDKASNDIDAGLAQDPQLQAQMMSIMRLVYDDLGLPAKAESLAVRSADVRLRVLGAKNPDTLEAESNVGWELFRMQRYAHAEKVLRDVLDQSRNTLGPENRTTLGAMRALCASLDAEHRGPEAEELARETLQIHLRVFGPEKAETINAMDNLAGILFHEHQNAEAEKLYRQTLDFHLRRLGPEHPITLLSMSNLAEVLADEQKLPEAEELYRRVLELDRRILGPNHPQLPEVMNAFANVLSDEHHYDEAEELNQEALEIRRRLFGPDDPVTASSTYNLACLAALKGKPHRAVSLLSEALDHGLSADLALGMEKDSDLRSLHSDPRFAALVSRAKQRAVGAESH